MTKSFSLTFAKDLANEFSNEKTDQYFLMFGKVDEWTNAPYSTGSVSTAAANVDSVEKANYALRDGLALKRISSRNIYHMIPRNNWTYGTAYDEYDHTVNMFSSKTFFVYTSTGNIYKCIFNNNGAVSQYEPDHTQSEVLTYSDGYRWKFICKVTEDSQDFITEEYVPVSVAVDDKALTLNQWNNQQAASNGSIEYVKTTSPSSAFTAAQWTKSSTDNKEIGANAAVGDISLVLNSANNQNTTDYYKGYAIYISSGSGVGQRRVITGYNQADNVVSFTDALTSEVTVSEGGVQGSRYQIIPNLVFDGDGSSAEGIPVLNTENEITSVTMINSGTDYTIADITAYPRGVSGGDIGSNDIEGPTFSAIIPPYGGHGKNVLREMDGSKIMIRTSIPGTDANFNALGNEFRQISIVKNPLLSGGTNDGNIAGSEITRKKQLTVRRPYFMTASYNDSAFAVGNSVMGETSKATGKIESWVTDPQDPTTGTLELSNVQGTFDLEDPESNLTRFVFNGNVGNTGDFTIGYTVKQPDASPVPVGKVVAWSAPAGGPYELIVNVTSNSFDSTNTVQEYNLSDVTTFSWGGIDTKERKMGELLKHYSSTQGTTFEFKLFPDDNGWQNVARANSITDVQSEDVLEGTYRMTTTLVITDSGSSLTDSSYTKDDMVYQIGLDSGLTGTSVSGKIVDWDATNGNTGIMVINDVRGTFAEGGFSGGTNHTITGVSGPEIQIGSGEVLYIQNIRPVTRNTEQDEEIKVMIGF